MALDEEFELIVRDDKRTFGANEELGKMLNIPNLKISSANHVWNLVYLDNNWLHLDLTWDDIENNRYRDNYFLITKEKLLSLDTKEHNFDNSFFVEGS